MQWGSHNNNNNKRSYARPFYSTKTGNLFAYIENDGKKEIFNERAAPQESSTYTHSQFSCTRSQVAWRIRRSLAEYRHINTQTHTVALDAGMRRWTWVRRITVTRKRIFNFSALSFIYIISVEYMRVLVLLYYLCRQRSNAQFIKSACFPICV